MASLFAFLRQRMLLIYDADKGIFAEFLKGNVISREIMQVPRPTATMKKPAIMYRPAMQRFTMKFMVRASLFLSFMVAVMKAVTKEPAILLGFSDGAYTAYKVASMYPERVDRVIAIGAGTIEKRIFQRGNEGRRFSPNRC